jgi:ribosomal protein L29
MKKQDVAKLNNRSAEELLKDADVLREKIWEMRREIAGGKIKNVKAKRALRKDLARTLTVVSIKGLQKTKKSGTI